MLARVLFKDHRLRPLLRVLVYIVAAVCAQIALGIFVGAVYQAIYGPRAMFMRTPVLLDETIAAMAVVGIAVVLRIFLDRRSVASLGITLGAKMADSRARRYTSVLALVGWGILLGAGMQLLVFAILLALHQTNVFALHFDAAVGYIVLAWMVIFFVAALAEEYPLRGYILQNLWEEWGFWPGAIVTSVMFALIHFKNPYFGDLPWMTLINIAADGLWACLAVLWTRSLWLAWAAHFAWNVFEGPVLGTPVSGIHTGASIVLQGVSGNPLLTGGRFGPEGGAIVLLAEAVGLLALYFLYRCGAFAHAPDSREQYALTAA